MIQKQPKTVLYDEVVESVLDCLDEKSIERLINLQFSEEFDERMQVTADKCTEDELTEEDRSDYKAVVELLGWLSLLQLRARQRLDESKT
ncbi:MAG TPA: hypothetical protein VMP01_04645 [Pirellulaceae bacterium]|nr:hypothetical protein [Pirellulaceae bacterium]